MTKIQQNEKGFTLVELAIVMAIIGLLIAGIMKGQALMENTRVAATVTQVKNYESAVTTFRDTYSSWPGDMVGAQNRIANCTAACNPPAANAGDGIVGGIGAAGTVQGVTAVALLPAGAGAETTLFWSHLLLADMINGITDATLQNNAGGWDLSHPAAKIGGGFVVANSNGTIAAFPGNTGTTPTQTVLILQANPFAVPVGVLGGGPLTPLRAAQIDRKMDDGKSDIGSVQAYGLAASCFTGGANADSYSEIVDTTDCGLIIRIQG